MLKKAILGLSICSLIGMSGATVVLADTLQDTDTNRQSVLYSGQYPYHTETYIRYSEDYEDTGSKLRFDNRKIYMHMEDGEDLPFGEFKTFNTTVYYGDGKERGEVSNRDWDRDDDDIMIPGGVTYKALRNDSTKYLNLSYDNKKVEHTATFLLKNCYPNSLTLKAKERLD